MTPCALPLKSTFGGCFNKIRSITTKQTHTTSSPHSKTKQRITAMSAFNNFSDINAKDFTIAIMGDLHLPANPAPITEFEIAREQLVNILNTTTTTASRVVQLGDLGSYEKGWPGSSACFSRAKTFLDGFHHPVGMVLGNHDLEAWEEFETDEENLAAWQAIFDRKHYWSAELGPAVLIGISTTRFRSNNFSCHEVYICPEQIAFLKQKLEENKGKPVIIFTHAPPMGCGLKAMQTVHVKNRCAWLNHSENPTQFIQLVEQYPNIKCWFSGHFHLSQNFPDSVNIVGSTAFILTNVIGNDSARNDDRQSRVLQGDEHGFQVYTVDHDTGNMRLDLKGGWGSGDPIEYLTPEDELICDIESGWLCSKIDCSVDLPIDGDGDNTTNNNGTSTSISSTNKALMQAKVPYGSTWLNAGQKTMICLMEGIVIEYDLQTMSPFGAVFLNVPEQDVMIRLMDGNDDVVDGINTDGSSAVAVELYDTNTMEVLQRTVRNDEGCFWQVFQKNKYRAWLAKREAEEAEKKIAAGAEKIAA